MRAYRASMEELRRQCESEETVRRQAIINAEHQRALQLRLVENMQKWEQAVRLRRFIDPAATGIGEVSEEEGVM